MTMDRRTLLSAGAGLGALAAARSESHAGPREVHALQPGQEPAGAPQQRSAHGALKPGSLDDQTVLLQALIEAAAQRGEPLHLPAGKLRIGALRLPTNAKLVGAHGLTILEFTGGPSFVTANESPGIALEGIVFDGGSLALDPEQATALLSFKNCANVSISRTDVRNTLGNGISVDHCAGKIVDCTITQASQAIFSTNAAGLEIIHNLIVDCTNNGILVWRDEPGEDGTLILNNRIARIGARAGGTGENGNGVNVFRAGSVMVANNRITDCAYSAVRGNAASNIQMIANSCARLGEVALYAEFGLEGAVIANNVIDTAATGVSVTNFNEGGRLAIVQGNLIRNLVRREHEPEDKRGEAITIEADTLVTGNVIENAATCGIKIGWGRYMRDCVVSQNLIRGARAGILISAEAKDAKVLIAGNMVSGAKDGAIRMMTLGVAQGPDLAHATTPAGNISISGNMA